MFKPLYVGDFTVTFWKFLRQQLSCPRVFANDADNDNVIFEFQDSSFGAGIYDSNKMSQK